MRSVSLVLLVIVFLVSLALTSFTRQNILIEKRARVTKSNIPVLEKGVESFPVLSAMGIIAIDEDSGIILYEKNADTTLMPASTTKIITALVAMDYYKPEDVLTVRDARSEGQKMKLFSGEQMTFDNLLKGLLIYSANDAAEVLMQDYPGGRESFVKAMNEKARAINLSNTTFVNPTGLDEAGHVSTPRDLVLASEVAMRNPKFAQVVGTKVVDVSDISGKFFHHLTNVNELLGMVDGVLGVKTGWTEGARENLVTYIKRGDKKVFIALLGSQDRFGETKELINWIFSSYQWVDPREAITYRNMYQ